MVNGVFPGLDGSDQGPDGRAGELARDLRLWICPWRAFPPFDFKALPGPGRGLFLAGANHPASWRAQPGEPRPQRPRAEPLWTSGACLAPVATDMPDAGGGGTATSVLRPSEI
ncbi:hypothetical protein GCM10007890_61560 [Methylobacterium tardum]|uniref:Uncharacterized protein n=1 Tax=Methylobacterium tardum TaxID=374432 RepID=A0AA37WV52_9HYPH|nr:hypothetical protein GCM10007890_61560 [Methylobacterium tardum]